MCLAKHLPIIPNTHRDLFRGNWGEAMFAWLAKQFASHAIHLSGEKLISWKFTLLKSKLDYRLSFFFIKVITSDGKMGLTLCFVTNKTAQFSCTNDLWVRKQEEIRRGCRVYCRCGSTDRKQLRCHSHHIGTCMKKGQTQLSIQLSEQDKVLSSERVDSIDSTKVDFTFILKVTNSFF